jgi:uncharacterized membrane protein
MIFLLGAFARLVTVGRESLWYDEAISYLTADLPLAGILNNSVQDPHPPLYYLVLHFWRDLIPGGVAAARLLSVLLGVALIPAVYRLAFEMLKEQTLALAAAMGIAISPFQILYSHELRMYTLLMFLVVIQGLAYLKARNERSLWWWLACGLFSVCALYTHLFGFLALIAICLHALIYRRERQALKATYLLLLISILLFLPWIYVLSSESGSGSGSLRPLMQDRGIEFHPLKPITTLTFLLFGESGQPWYVALSFFLAISTVVILLMELRRALGATGDTRMLLPGLMVIAMIGFPNVLFFVRPFFLPERTMAAASPFLFILLAWGTTRRKSPLPYLSVPVAMLLATGSLMYLSGDPIKPPYEAAIRWVEERHRDGDTVLHTSDGSYLPSLGYVNFPHHALLAGDPDQRKPDKVYEMLGVQRRSLPQAVENSNRLWLVVALEHSVEWQTEQAALVGNKFRELDSHQVGGITIKLYQLGGG